MATAEAGGLPIAVDVADASPHEITLVERALDARFTAQRPRRLVADKAFDSDPPDRRLRRNRRITLIAPHRANRTRPATQDGRPLRRMRRRWRVERLFAWLFNFRRLVVRYEYHLENYLGMLLLGCMLILIRRF